MGGGVSNARNIGIGMATGQKIFFWDSDDVIELDAIEKCIEFSINQNVSAVLYSCSSRVDGINGEKKKSSLREKYIASEIREELMPHFIGHSFSDINDWISGKKGLRDGKEYTALWRIMLDSKVIKENKLLFDTNLSLGEDTIFINSYFLVENSIGYLDECLYHLTWRDSGANITSNSNPDLMMDNKIKLIHARCELDKKAHKYNLELHRYWEGTMVFSAIQLLVKFSLYNTDNAYNKFQKYLSIPEVQEAIKEFKPLFKIKGIPFILLRFRRGQVLYFIMQVLPNKIINRFI